MQAVTPIPVQPLVQRPAIILPQTLGRLAGPAVFLSELLRVAARQGQHANSGSSGDAPRPMAFVPLAAMTAATPGTTTPKRKREKKKSSAGADIDALAGLIARR